MPKKKLERHLDREDFSRSGFAWAVAEKYDIVSDYKKYETYSDYVVVKKVGDAKLYAPLEDPNLFYSFTKLASRGDPSDKSILRWVHKYGLPKQAELEDSLLYVSGGELNQAPIPIEELKGEALQAHNALNLYHDLYRGDIESLKETAGKLREHHEWRKPLRMKKGFAEERGYEDKRDDRWDVNLTGVWVAEIELENFVSTKVENVRPDLSGGGFWDPSDDGYRPKQSWRCPDLLSAMYLQFYLLITNSLPLERCENPACQMPFVTTRKNKRFCNSTCRSNMRHYQ